MGMKTWVVVLIKDFDSAKQRLRPALGNKSRRSLARQNARLAVRAASAGDHVLVVAGSEEVSEMAAAWGADVLLEPREEGQNAAAGRGIKRAVEGGAGAVLLLSSDLPLVTAEAVRGLIDSVERQRVGVMDDELHSSSIGVVAKLRQGVFAKVQADRVRGA